MPPCGFATLCYKNHSVVRCTFYNFSVGTAFIPTVVESTAPCYSFYNKASYRRHCGYSYRYYINVIAFTPKRFLCNNDENSDVEGLNSDEDENEKIEAYNEFCEWNNTKSGNWTKCQKKNVKKRCQKSFISK